MAEAMVVEEHSTVPKRFFCHMCNVEINIPNTDFTCPLCTNGFVEELPANAPELSASTSNNATNHDTVTASTSLSGANATSSGSGSGSGGGGGGGGGGASGSGIINVESLRNDIVSLLSMRNMPNLEITIEPNRRNANVVHLGGTGSNAPSSRASSVGGGRVRPANLDRLDNVLFDFLHSLPIGGGTAEIVTGPGGSFGVGGSGHSHMFFMGNPGDYAWGREGLDTIVTQMLNQMETSGPPPLSSQRINEIPNVKISAEDVERKMQCSVCWDDFKLDESVRKLPCSHLYHENCIVPWLNLHSTCPICRKSLTNEDENDDGTSTDEDYVLLSNLIGGNGRGRDGSANSSSNSTSNVTARPPASTNASSQTTTTQSEPTTAATQPNNVFTYDDDNMFLD